MGQYPQQHRDTARTIDADPKTSGTGYASAGMTGAMPEYAQRAVRHHATSEEPPR